MDLETLIRRAAQRDVGAFVELTRRFQQFGSALAMVGDFHRAAHHTRACWWGLPSTLAIAMLPAACARRWWRCGRAAATSGRASLRTT
jgi:hypothetical protein